MGRLDPHNDGFTSPHGECVVAIDLLDLIGDVVGIEDVDNGLKTRFDICHGRPQTLATEPTSDVERRRRAHIQASRSSDAYRYFLPRLKEARAKFEEILGQQINWKTSDEEAGEVISDDPVPS